MSTQEPSQPAVMPDSDGDANFSRSPEDVLAAIVVHIHDDIEDRKSLREWRKTTAVFLAAVSALFYAVLLFVVLAPMLWTGSFGLLLGSPAVYGTIVIVLAAVGTLLALIVAKAVFGQRGQTKDAPYTPIQAVLKLMKEMRDTGL